ncbi:MAG: rhodanese-like domain-containing protein [Muribaculaceae bacterium]|nr:rhodanese-like domain-containing protein [Muribaculaceae bacterium]
MNPTEFSEAIKSPEVFLLDVRPQSDFEKTHIEGAHNIDVMDTDFDNEAMATLPKDKTIAVYCTTGKHSAIAQQKLLQLGYNVINLDNGINSWIAAGLPTT